MTPFEAHILIQQTIIPDALISPRRNNTIRTTCVSNTQTKLNATTSTEPPLSNSSGTTESLLREALKSHRLNPNIRFKNESLLCTTIKRGCPNLLKLFLEHGADPNLKSYENGRYEPALITAVRYKSLSCVQILLEYGANLSKTNFYGYGFVCITTKDYWCSLAWLIKCKNRHPILYDHNKRFHSLLYFTNLRAIRRSNSVTKFLPIPFFFVS